MKFYLYDFSDYTGMLSLHSEDWENECEVDVSGFYNEETEEYDEDGSRPYVEAKVKERFGEDAVVEWYFV